MSPDEIKPSFPVFTYRSQIIPKYINVNDPFGVTEMGINPEGNIYFIIHGFLDSGKNMWVSYYSNKMNFKTFLMKLNSFFVLSAKT